MLDDAIPVEGDAVPVKDDAIKAYAQGVMTLFATIIMICKVKFRHILRYTLGWAGTRVI